MYISNHPVVLGVLSLALRGDGHSFHHDKADTAALQRRSPRSERPDGTTRIRKEKA
jgi:hypothetical protein